MAKKVVVYSTTTCPYCHMEKAYLKSKGVAFEDVVLDVQQDKIPEFVDICGNMGVPCTHIVKDDGTEQKILGFDKPTIDTALGLS
ncbi:MAG TPA: glutaredoxin domain-containing protein [Candidatus Saccharimonadales bacterium]|nr:glutaredoxin domain-containing protein [Candidatus Saccharimonadales bacterium]